MVNVKLKQTSFERKFVFATGLLNEPIRLIRPWAKSQFLPNQSCVGLTRIRCGTKLHGRECGCRVALLKSFQPVRHAPVDPGKQKIAVLFAIPATARDWSVDIPISSFDKARTFRQSPALLYQTKGDTASGMLSRI